MLHIKYLFRLLLQTTEYKAVNPLSQLPTLTDGNVTIYESGAIIEYLLERYGEQIEPLKNMPNHSSRLLPSFSDWP